MPEYSHTTLRSSSKRLLQWGMHSSTRAIGERRALALDLRPRFPWANAIIKGSLLHRLF